ncbi:hypothetical protein CHCC20335_3072 [Bacillus paralicheniformis]|nr:hypothetical protein CHCC20335_3072 [Bacillus paralicheniformis]
MPQILASLGFGAFFSGTEKARRTRLSKGTFYLYNFLKGEKTSGVA